MHDAFAPRGRHRDWWIQYVFISFLCCFCMIYVSGRVYAARVASPHPMASVTVAVKRCWTDKKVKNPMLLHEACAMLLVRGNFSVHFLQDYQFMSGAIIGHPAIPHIYAYGRSQCFEYIALERLGPSIDSSLRKGGMLGMRRGLTMRNLIALTCQMVNSLLFPCVWRLTSRSWTP